MIFLTLQLVLVGKYRSTLSSKKDIILSFFKKQFIFIKVDYQLNLCMDIIELLTYPSEGIDL